jgi:hypothetical protein
MQFMLLGIASHVLTPAMKRVVIMVVMPGVASHE